MIKVAIFSVLVAMAFAADPAYPAPKYSKDYEYEYQLRPFDFAYGVKDEETYNDHSRQEASDGKVVTGSYRVVLPDGRTQIVTYKADSNGFVSDVKYEGEAKYPEYKPTYPKAAYPEPAYPKPTYPAKPAYPEPAYPKPAYPAKPAYPEPSYPEPTYLKPAYPVPAYPVPSYTKPAYPVPSYTKPAYPAPSYPKPEYVAPSSEEGVARTGEVDETPAASEPESATETV